MAAKKTTKPASSTQPLARLQASMKNLQRDAEKLLKQTRQQASSIISRDQKKAVDRLIGQAQKLRKDLEQRVRRAGRDFEGQTEKFLKTLEKEATKRISGLLDRLEIPSKSELNAINRRLSELEKKIGKSRPAPRATRSAAPAPAKTVVPDDLPQA